MTTATREATAERLLRASLDHSYEPATAIDWDAPLLPGAYYQPPERCSLYGTALWDGLTEEQRIELSKHEVASIASVGVWFELILMQMLVRHAYDRDPRTAHVQYALTEIADECRHSIMFGRMIEKMDCPAYGPGRLATALGRFFKTTSMGPLIFAAALYVEEILDARQREAMRDDSLQPLTREVSRIHVVEEARHIRYARAEVATRFAKLPKGVQERERFVLSTVAVVATRNLIHPGCYAAVGLDPKEARRVARNNPYWKETQRFAARRAVAFFKENGMIGGPGVLNWKRLGLL
ncbi:MAG: AurF N-oxygenase family protein [Actinomycetes bacterium]